MSSPKKYWYMDKQYTLQELSEIGNISISALRTRIKLGWDIEEAVTKPLEEKYATVDPQWRGKPLIVMFTSPLSSVKQNMQPRMNKEYIARPNQSRVSSGRSREYFIINLENGLPLIVYPKEFEVLREAVV